jgi:hypothetical protein
MDQAGIVAVLGKMDYEVFVLTAADGDRRNGQAYALSRQVLERGRCLILADPKGIEPAVALARDIVAKAPTTDYAALLQRAASAA